MTRRHSFNLERLEVRDTPAQFGIPWEDHHVTLSFVPDGTPVDGVPSGLSALLGEQGQSDATWKTEFLRAAQTWLKTADLSIGVVADDGQPIGSPGLSQGDRHFGDIRVSARPLTSEVLAVTVPPGPSGGTRAGDVIFNSNYSFGMGASDTVHDIFSVALQEMGHALGISNSSDINSPMYEIYQGVRTGITGTDQATIQSLYGERSADANDQSSSNGSFGNATAIATPAALLPLTSAVFGTDGDLTTTSDNDYFKFIVPINSSGTISVRIVAAGQSLLVSRASVFTSSGMIRATLTSSSPLNNDLALAVPNVLPTRTYYVQVEKAPGTNPFAIGSYRVEVDFNPTSPLSLPTIIGELLDDDNTNNTLATATILNSVIGNSNLFVTDAVLGATDLDVFRIHTPAASSSSSSNSAGDDNSGAGTGSSGSAGSGQSAASLPDGAGALADPSYTLTVSIRSANPGNGLLPTAVVANAAGTFLPHKVVRNADGEMVLQVMNVAADADVYVFAAADTVGSLLVGEYHLEASLSLPVLAQADLYTGTLTEDVRIDFHTLVVNFSAITHFLVEVGGPAGVMNVGGQFTVYDEAGAVVLNQFVKPNRALSTARYLAPGEYTIRMKGLTQVSDMVLPNLAFQVRHASLSDPIGPGGENPDLFNDNYDDGDFGDDYYADQCLDDPDGPEW